LKLVQISVINKNYSSASTYTHKSWLLSSKFKKNRMLLSICVVCLKEEQKGWKHIWAESQRGGEGVSSWWTQRLGEPCCMQNKGPGSPKPHQPHKSKTKSPMQRCQLYFSASLLVACKYCGGLCAELETSNLSGRVFVNAVALLHLDLLFIANFRAQVPLHMQTAYARTFKTHVIPIVTGET
jgi:hypothetical protein